MKRRFDLRAAVLLGALLVATPLPADTPYTAELSTLAQRYYRQCRAEARLRDQVTADFNRRHLPEPPLDSFLDTLPPANRRDAQLVCMGAAMQQLDDSATPGRGP